MNLRIIISGAPGTGKSTLLTALRKMGYDCFDEVSRELIRDEMRIGGTRLPWIDLPQFAEVCYARMIRQLAEAKTSAVDVTFFDRGIPDLIGYLRCSGQAIRPHFRLATAGYTPAVLLAPLWPKIYVNEPERPQSLADAAKLDGAIRSAYRECGFALHELPCVSVAERVDWVRHILGLGVPAF